MKKVGDTDLIPQKWLWICQLPHVDDAGQKKSLGGLKRSPNLGACLQCDSGPGSQLR